MAISPELRSSTEVLDEQIAQALGDVCLNYRRLQESRRDNSPTLITTFTGRMNEALDRYSDILHWIDDTVTEPLDGRGHE